MKIIMPIINVEHALTEAVNTSNTVGKSVTALLKLFKMN